MRKFLLILLALIPLCGFSQSKVYRGNSTYSSDVLYTWDGKHLYRGNSTYSSDILFTWDGKHLYQGNSTYSSDVLATWDGKYIYRGRSNYSSDVVLTWDGFRLYRGRSTYSSDTLYTIDAKYVYPGRSTYSSDILLTVSGRIPIPILAMLLQFRIFVIYFSKICKSALSQDRVRAVIDSYKRRRLFELGAVEEKPDEMKLGDAIKAGYRKYVQRRTKFDFVSEQQARDAGFIEENDGCFYREMYVRPLEMTDEEFKELISMTQDSATIEVLNKLARSISTIKSIMWFWVLLWIANFVCAIYILY